LTLLRIFHLWSPVAGFMILVYALSGSTGFPGADRVWDKALHAVAYGGFAVACLRAFHGGLRRLEPGRTLGAMLLALAYAAFDEWHQRVVPGRDASIGDWVADAVGAMAALVAIAWATGRRAGGGPDQRARI
jgi:VanZ family protein